MAKLLSRCCPSGYSCGVLSNSLVGCCPSGTVCSGFAGQVTTMTVKDAAFATATVAANPPYVGVGVQTTTAMVTNVGGGVFVGTQQSQANGNGVFTGGGILLQTTSAKWTIPAGFVACTTMVMNGDFLPTTRQAPCGTMLILPGSARTNSIQDSWLLFLGSLLLRLFI